MKYYHTILFLLITTAGCSCTIGDDMPPRQFTVEHRQFEKHDYLIFHSYGNNHGDPIVHDPDCFCQKINQK